MIDDNHNHSTFPNYDTRCSWGQLKWAVIYFLSFYFVCTCYCCTRRELQGQSKAEDL